jgi:hypothetical protein
MVEGQQGTGILFGGRREEERVARVEGDERKS